MIHQRKIDYFTSINLCLNRDKTEKIVFSLNHSMDISVRCFGLILNGKLTVEAFVDARNSRLTTKSFTYMPYR